MSEMGYVSAVSGEDGRAELETELRDLPGRRESGHDIFQESIQPQLQALHSVYHLGHTSDLLSTITRACPPPIPSQLAQIAAKHLKQVKPLFQRDPPISENSVVKFFHMMWGWAQQGRGEKERCHLPGVSIQYTYIHCLI